MSGGSRGAYGEGFVERAVEALDRATASVDDRVRDGDRDAGSDRVRNADSDRDAEAVARALSETLAADALGYGEHARERDGRVVRLRDGDGVVAAVLAAVGPDGDAADAVETAFAAAEGEPSVRYVVAAGLDRLLAFERVDDDEDGPAGDDAVTVAGVTASRHTDVPVDSVVAAGRRGPLSQTLPPGRQLAVAKLAELRREALSAGDRAGDLDATGSHSIADDGGLETLVGTLRDCLDDLLAPAVAEAGSALSGETVAFDGRAADLREAARAASRGDGDETAAGPARRRLLALEREHADARALRAAYGTWVRGAGRTGYTPSENRRAFARVAAFQLIEEALLARSLAGVGVLAETVDGDAVDRLESFAEAAGLDRDAGDLFRLSRERRREVIDRRAPNLAGWALADDGVAEALSRTVWYLDHFSFDAAPVRVAEAYDRLLSVADLPGDWARPASGGTPGSADADPLPAAALDAAGYDPAVAGGDDAPDLLDPAVGDGRYLLAAADRIRAGLDDAEPTERLRAVAERLTGASADPLACRVTETRLVLSLLDDWRDVRRRDGAVALDPPPVYCTDPLIRDEFEPAALAREDYDYVVGSPPATLRRDVAAGPVADAYAGYETAHYTYDTSALYVERAADWLGENGTLAVRIAGRFRDTRFGEKLRERLPQWFRLEALREVAGEAAGGTPVLLVARRFRRNESFVDPDDYEPPTYGFTYAEGLDAPGIERSSARLTAGAWDWDADGDDDAVGL
ncbi:hypothetical protein Hbl1158_14285 [Halobaculum sp. CBA1158]|uniref:hypothetical protein n=1 Tax=Halobaculum sp. CBA1158 TaxID=2904243 RepID=UPI001F33508B|nr:hypothetical protein [Halobaculum sp. CBA1158]UIO99674.1 hypothetical protein Hbl1158_14285 [Halobaculum sp. CBA1158]